MVKILFYGFRHSHVKALYKKVSVSPLAEIAGCVEENDEARLEAEKSLGAKFSTMTYGEWLSTDVDAVAIGKAYGDRGRAVISALKAGKHIITDKPLCTSLEELEEIISLSREKDLKIVCMLDLRYLPQSLAAKELIASGELGEVRNIAFNGQHCLDYANRPSWYFEEGMHGGTINDLAIHGIDLVRMLTGLEFSSVDAARVWNSYATKHTRFKDSALFMARLENGAGVLADVSYSSPFLPYLLPTYWEFRIWCDKGLIEFNYGDSVIKVYREGLDKPILKSCEGNSQDYLDDFLFELDGGREMSESLFLSTRSALTIQRKADSEH